MDTRAARRTAERAARDLLTSRTAVIGDLAVKSAEQAQLEAELTAVHERGRQLIEAAQAEADRLVAEARDLITASRRRYDDAHTAAVAAGWTPADLAALGYPPPQTQPPTGGNRGRRSAGPSTDPRPQDAGSSHPTPAEPPRDQMSPHEHSLAAAH